jgi:hypothetical protein
MFSSLLLTHSLREATRVIASCPPGVANNQITRMTESLMAFSSSPNYVHVLVQFAPTRCSETSGANTPSANPRRATWEPRREGERARWPTTPGSPTRSAELLVTTALVNRLARERTRLGESPFQRRSR